MSSFFKTDGSSLAARGEGRNLSRKRTTFPHFSKLGATAMQVADVGEHNPRRLRELWRVFAAFVVARFAGPQKLGKSMMGEVASRVVLLEPTNTR